MSKFFLWTAVIILIMKTPQHYVSEKPNLLKEWNWDKNKCISPNSIGCGSNKRYGGNVAFVVMNGRLRLIPEMVKRDTDAPNVEK